MNERLRADLKQKLTELKIKEKNASGNELLLIKDTIVTIQDILNAPMDNEVTLSQTIKSQHKFYEKNPVAWPVCEEFARVKGAELEYSYDFGGNLDEAELWALLDEFFHTCTPPDIAKKYEEIRYGANNSIIINDKTQVVQGLTFYLPYYDINYIELNRSHEIDDVSCLAHEFGHGIQYKTNYSPRLMNQLGIFVEIVSMFMEMIALHHVAKKDKYEKFAIIAMADKWERFKDDSDNIVDALNVFRDIDKVMKKKKCKLGPALNKVLEDVDQQHIEAVFSENIGMDSLYVFALSITTQLFAIYLKDPDRAFYLVKKIMLISTKLNQQEYFNELVKLGIEPNSCVKEYNDYLLRELKRI